MKKYLAFIAILVCFSMVLSSCIAAEPTSNTTASTDAGKTVSTETAAAPAASVWSSVAQYKKDAPYTIGWSINNEGVSWRTEYVEEFNQEAKRFGSLIKETIVLNADSDVNKQIADIEDLLAKKVDAIIIDPQSPDALVPVVEKAYASGIPVIIVNDTINTDKYTAFVSVNHFDFGRVGAEWLVKQMGGKGNLVILDGIAGMGVAIERYNGAMSVFEKYPDIKVVAHEYASWSYDAGKIATQNILAAQPKIDGVWSSGGDMTLGAVDAFNEAGRALIPMSGEAANGFIKKAIAEQPKGFHTIAPYMPTWLSAAALNTAVNALIGFPVQKDTIYSTPTFTEDQFSQIVRTDLPDSYWLGSLLPDDVIKELFKGQ